MVVCQIHKGFSTDLLCTLLGNTDTAEVKGEISLQSSVLLDC